MRIVPSARTGPELKRVCSWRFNAATYRERARMHTGLSVVVGPLFDWEQPEGEHGWLWEFYGYVELPSGALVAFYREEMWSTITPIEGSMAQPRRRTAAFRGTHMKGVRAALFGPEKNPYPDHRTYRGGVTFSRAFAKQWDEGFEEGGKLKHELHTRGIG